MMQAGDVVRLRLCAQQGRVAMITLACERSHLAKSNPKLAIYWVLIDAGVQCFTGSQIVKMRRFDESR
jgi:hypothetical protein